MKKLTALMLILLVIAVVLRAYHKRVEPPKSTEATAKPAPANPPATAVVKPEAIAKPTTIETYTNAKGGFSFPYPSSWIKQGAETEAVNRTGKVTAISVKFADTVSQTNLTVEYYLAPNGKEIYRYAKSQFEAKQGKYSLGASTMRVGGKDAIAANTAILTDGRGNKLNPLIRSMVIDVLDKSETGDVELQFSTPVNYEAEQVPKFNKLLAGFKFEE